MKPIPETGLIDHCRRPVRSYPGYISNGERRRLYHLHPLALYSAGEQHIHMEVTEVADEILLVNLLTREYRDLFFT
jgi:hypothetical protein